MVTEWLNFLMKLSLRFFKLMNHMCKQDMLQNCKLMFTAICWKKM